MYRKIVITVIILTLISCNSTKTMVFSTKGKKTKSNYSSNNGNKSTSNPVVTSDLVNGYIFHYKDIAISNMKNYGIPASIILAQGILESGAGQSKLSLTSNNHFGIKCYTDWKGETTFYDDDKSQECFRKYKNPEESFQDHANIVSKRTRYASLFELPKDDYKGWAKGLRAAGYATDPKYPEKLINYIERYHLDQYDAMVMNGKETSRESKRQGKKELETDMKNSRSTQYQVQQGDTLYSISKKFNIPIDTIMKQNNLSDNAISIGQTLIIK